MKELKISYTKNYLKIYLWQIISLVLNFFAMFVVIPFLASSPTLYGIYTICISVNIFLSYADLGFISAGQKYAAEYYAQGKLNDESRIIGFSGFILLFFTIILSIIFFYLSCNPNLLIKDLSIGRDTETASSLLFILAIFAPSIVLQRLVSMIFGIRLQEYIAQRVLIITSFIRILSVFFFFRNGEYNIIGFFLFTQVVNLFAYIILLFVAHYRFSYDLYYLFSSFRFNVELFKKTKKIAFPSLIITIAWILYYELDSFVIGKTLGANKVAIYAIGFTILTFFRSIFGILFTPFSFRFNHFIGMGQFNELKSFYIHVTTLMSPLVVLPIVTIVILAKSFVFSWVGYDYEESIGIIKLLVLCNIFGFISYPTSMLLIAQERIREMYFLNIIMPIIYWIGVMVYLPFLGVKAFALSKFIIFCFSAFYYFILLKKYVNITYFDLVKRYIKPLLLPLVVLCLLLMIGSNYLPYEKSRFNLICTVVFGGLCTLIAFGMLYFSSQDIRKYILHIKRNCTIRSNHLHEL